MSQCARQIYKPLITQKIEFGAIVGKKGIRVPMLTQLSPDVFAWSEPHGKSGRRYRWFSYAIRVAEKGVFALVDLLQASAREIHALAAIGPPTHVLRTCNWHFRNAEAY